LVVLACARQPSCVPLSPMCLSSLPGMGSPIACHNNKQPGCVSSFVALDRTPGWPANPIATGAGEDGVSAAHPTCLPRDPCMWPRNGWPLLGLLLGPLALTLGAGAYLPELPRPALLRPLARSEPPALHPNRAKFGPQRPRGSGTAECLWLHCLFSFGYGATSAGLTSGVCSVLKPRPFHLVVCISPSCTLCGTCPA
jgi:hypothetical protein